MTQIRPFCGLRPVPEYAAEIAALPYDVMDTEEARQILNKNPLSFLRVTKSEATMSDCIDPHSQAVYKMAKTNLDRYLSDGQMKRYDALLLYLPSADGAAYPDRPCGRCFSGGIPREHYQEARADQA